MKRKPLLFSKIQTTHTSFTVNFDIESNITFIVGDSGTGKSAVFSFLQEMAAEDKRIKCYNFLDKSKSYKASIQKSKGKLIVIDNADILLNDNMRWHIATDAENQYIIIGRNPSGLMLNLDDMMELVGTTVDGKTNFTLKHYF